MYKNQNWKQLSKQIYSFVLRTKIYHFFFWIVYIFFCAIIIQPGAKPSDWLYFTSVILFFHALVAYFNAGVLVKHLLFKRYYISYAFCLALSIIAVGFPIAIVFHSFVHNQDLQKFVWSSNFFFLNWASILLTTLIVLTLKLLFNWYKEEQVNKTLQQVNVETELKFLKSQINPHFLFNSLNNLYALTLIKSDKAPSVVLKLSNILRYVLYETADGPVKVEKEVEYLKDYLELEQIRLDHKLELNFQTQGNLALAYIEPMIFLTFLENSLKHGISQTTQNPWLNISILVDKKNIVFQIENPIVNLPSSTEINKNGGIGLVNLQKRLDILYHNKYQLQIQNKSTYKVTLTIIHHE